MSNGRVYLWTPDSHELLGGHVEKEVVPIPGLTADAAGNPHLSGRLVSVRNGGRVNIPDSEGRIRAVPIGDAQRDDRGNFCFDPGRGGGRMDKVTLADSDFRLRYIQASHFGEVNTYYHLHRIASYVEALLQELGAPKLPQVIAVVNAHHAATERARVRDGELSAGRWKAFQGGHYRLPGRRFHIDELHPVAETGEIHLGPGRQLLTDGALVRMSGDRYRANASHNAGIVYHEYGHHITRHTSDFRSNASKSPQSQDNRKMALDEGTCDYWTAAMLETPHIWAWHRRHDEQEVHVRSLISRKTMDDFDTSPKANPHTNGTIWAAGLWDLRSELKRSEDDGARKCDLLVLKTLLSIGQIQADGARDLRRMRADYSRAMSTLLEADKGLYSGRHQSLILECFSRRKIFLPGMSAGEIRISSSNPAASKLLKRVSLEEIPADEDLCSGAELELYLQERNEPPLSVLTVGDIMLGERTRKVIREEGADYPFAGVAPLLRRSEIVFGNQEGPFAGEATKADRNFSYRVNPRLATALSRANVNVVTLANNHLTDCGRAGVLETLAALDSAGVAVVGAAQNERNAHRPVIPQAGRWRGGLLGGFLESPPAPAPQRAGRGPVKTREICVCT